MSQFIETYKSYTNAELIEIIENSANYQTLAVDAAKQEIESRKLTDLELNEAKEELAQIRLDLDKPKEKKHEMISKAKRISVTITDYLNPIQKTHFSSDKIINVISLVFGGIAVYKIYNEIRVLINMFSNGINLDFYLLYYWLPVILITTAIILFFMRKKTGWILLCFSLVYSSFNTIGLLILTWNIKPTGVPLFDILMPVKSPIEYIMTFLFFGSSLWFISKSNVREVYQIDLRLMILTIGITLLITSIQFFS
jgi:hypothetical protein